MNEIFGLVILKPSLQPEYTSDAGINLISINQTQRQ